MIVNYNTRGYEVDPQGGTREHSKIKMNIGLVVFFLFEFGEVIN